MLRYLGIRSFLVSPTNHYTDKIITSFRCLDKTESICRGGFFAAR
ncbi:hypothetical protein BofuT4_uP050470.1 [Botrytis cinerea T4]|uniref:Uncharacterized protein n=1 Tax=Botryotinia fuckeliana (strain T4) TaxID=999810 RepID=G2XXS0_BOTF4|nr:hypothetical protein BofuT4_uP050470.1 [Botrytis cinerea T4]